MASLLRLHALSHLRTLSSPQRMLKRHLRPQSLLSHCLAPLHLDGATSDFLLRARLTSSLVAKASLLEYSTSAKELLSPQPILPEVPRVPAARPAKPKRRHKVEIANVFLRRHNLSFLFLIADHLFQSPHDGTTGATISDTSPYRLTSLHVSPFFGEC